MKKTIFFSAYTIIAKTLCGAAGGIIGFLIGGGVAAIIGALIGVIAGHLFEKLIFYRLKIT